MKDVLLEQFAEWNAFLEEIDSLDWNRPLGEGKWSVHDAVSHIYFWDKYFYEEAIRPISEDRTLTLKHLNFDEFNNNAKMLGKNIEKSELKSLSKNLRSLIINEIKQQDPSKFSRQYTDGDGKTFVVEQYLRDFIWHDRHHIKQIAALKETLHE